MSLLWDYFWPIAGLGLLIGGVAGSFAFRKNRPRFILIAAAISLAGAWLWHGPVGAADRIAESAERMARSSLDYYEMTAVSAHLYREPLSRNLRLTGPADDFQRSELVRVMSQIPGVREANWGDRRGMALLIEGLIAAAGGFLIGLLLAYGVELRRRYNAQWKW